MYFKQFFIFIFIINIFWRSPFVKLKVDFERIKTEIYINMITVGSFVWTTKWLMFYFINKEDIHVHYSCGIWKIIRRRKFWQSKQPWLSKNIINKSLRIRGKSSSLPLLGAHEEIYLSAERNSFEYIRTAFPDLSFEDIEPRTFNGKKQIPNI